MNTTGRALLVGIPEYDSSAIGNLPFVENDVERLSESLHAAGFETQVLGVGGSHRATRGKIISEVHNFCRTGRRDETLLVSFSGHGLHFEGQDYLVPADATVADEILQDLLVPVDFARSVMVSEAQSFLFFIDACREGVELGTMSSVALQRWSEGKIEKVAGHNVAYVFSCTAGEVSRYVSGSSDQFSLFSRSLADVLAPRADALSFGDATKLLQVRIDKLAREHGLPRQTIRVKREDSAADRRLDAVLLIPRGRMIAATTIVTEDFDGVVITSDDEKLLGFVDEGPSGESYVSIAGVLAVSNRFGISIGDVRERFRRFESAGVQLPEFQDFSESLLVHVVSKDDLVVLSRDLAGRRPFVSGPVSWIHALRASEKLSAPVRVVREVLQRYAQVLQLELPDGDSLESLEDQVVTSKDASVLASIGRLSRGPKGQVQVSPSEVLDASRRLNEPISAVTEILARYKVVGIDLTVDFSPIDDIVVSDIDMQALPRVHAWNTPAKISAVSVFRRSFQLKMPIREVIGTLNRFAPTIVTLPDVDFGEVMDSVVSSRETQILRAVEEDFNGDSVVSLPGLLLQSRRLSRSVAAVKRELDVYSKYGVKVPEGDFSDLGDDPVTDAELIVLSKDLDGSQPFFRGEVPAVHLLRASSRLGDPVEVIYERLRKFEPLFVSLPKADLGPLGTHIVSEEDFVALHCSRDGVFSKTDILAASARLGQPVGSVLNRLEKFASFGVELPDLDVSGLSNLNVSEDDIRLIQRVCGASSRPEQSTVSPASIIEASKDFQITVEEVLSRLKAFEPAGIEVASVDYSNLADRVVSAADLVALSRRFDGNPPFVAGAISAIHLLRVSGKLNESVGQVRIRIALFAPALGLSLPSGGAGAAARS